MGCSRAALDKQTKSIVLPAPCVVGCRSRSQDLVLNRALLCLSVTLQVCARKRKPKMLCARAKRDEALMLQTQAVWQANMQFYGADKVWHQMNREDTKVARCTVDRLMKRLGLHGVR